MKMEDIARLANVSKATVSKVINGKDSDISEETKSKVLRIVKENNYIPFMKHIEVIKKINGNICALVINYNNKNKNYIINKLIDELEKTDFDLIIKYYKDLKHLKKIIDELNSNKIGKAIVFGAEYFASEYTELFYISDTKHFDNKIKNVKFYRKSKATKLATDYLLNLNHKKIACLVEENETSIISGYRANIRDEIENGKSIYEYIWHNEDIKDLVDQIVKNKITAILVTSKKLLVEIDKTFEDMDIKIGEDISIIYIGTSELISNLRYTFVQPNLDKILEDVIIDIERENSDKDFISEIMEYDSYLCEGQSTKEFIDKQWSQPIIVIGSLNIDIVMCLDHLPINGEVQLVNKTLYLPGGKAANQAIWIKKLGGDVEIIGKLGKDRDGIYLFDLLKTKKVSVKGITFADNAPTGKAFINLDGNGESSISIDKGANDCLEVMDIDNNIQNFTKDRIVILSTEVSSASINKIITSAKECRLIIKPSMGLDIDKNLYKNIYMLVPNKKELDFLIKDKISMDEKVQKLLSRGIKNVIVTLDKDGCIWYKKNFKKYYEANKVKVVDATGGADAFISTLCFCINKNMDMDLAIRLSNYSGGIAVSNIGVQDCLVSKDILDILHNKDEYKEVKI